MPTPPNNPPHDAITIHRAQWPADLPTARTLLRHYEQHLLHNPSGTPIHLDGFDHELDHLAERWSEPTAAMLLARIDTVPAGCVALHLLPNHPGSAEMKRMWVEPTARGHGLGRALAQAAIAWARKHAAHELLLDTVPAVMPAANTLYAALGFQPAARYNTNPVPGVVFFRLLLP